MSQLQSWQACQKTVTDAEAIVQAFERRMDLSFPISHLMIAYFPGGVHTYTIIIAAWGQAANKRKAEGKPKAKPKASKPRKTKSEAPEPEAPHDDDAEWDEEEWPHFFPIFLSRAFWFWYSTKLLGHRPGMRLHGYLSERMRVAPS